MKATTAWRMVLLAVAALMAATTSPGAAPLDDLHEVVLDIDNDGKPDRAALVRNKDSRAFDLYIYAGTGDDKLDLSRKPTVLARGIATNLILGFEARGKGSLIVNFGCGGCSNDFSTTLTVVHRGGAFLVGGVTYDWETRNGAGTCDINFLTGKGTLSRDFGKAKAVQAKLAPVKLADWSDDKRPTVCD